MYSFAVVFIGFFLLFSYIAIRRIVLRLNLSRGKKIMMAVLVVVFAFFSEFALLSFGRRDIPGYISELNTISYYVMSYAFWLLYWIFIELGIEKALNLYEHFKARKNVENSEPANTKRRDFLGIVGMTAASIVTFPGVVYGAKRWREVVRKTLYYGNLPDALRGLRIVHLSDIHVGNSFGAKDVEILVEEVNKLDADLIAITGDIVDGYVKDVGKDFEAFKKLKSKLGIYYCTGNHEYYWEGDAWSRKLSSIGFRVLNNRHVEVRYNGAYFAVAGATDHKMGALFGDASSPQKALSGIPDEIFKIMLIHQPGSIPESVASGADLILVGHTHGGQFFPLNFVVGAMFKYSRGLYEEDACKIYVNRGTGYWGPPFRVANRPEITVLTLDKAP